ncbi:unnamed protein product, partial [Discosporangium mesarthrocarpum]
MNFFANQSLSVNQRRNPRLNEYFAVIGLGDDLQLVHEPLTPPLQTVPPPPPAEPLATPAPSPPPSASP